MAVFSVLGLALSAQQAVPAAAPGVSAGTALAENLRVSLAALGQAVAELDPDQLHAPDAERRVLADSQGSIRRNLRDAMPGLIAGFEAAPGNLGAAFRLYRDAGAVVTVAQRSAEILPQKDADAARPVESAAAAASRDLDALGNFIEARGQSDYTRLRRSAAAPAGPVAPKTLVIGDANGAKPPAKKKIPH